MLNYIVIQGWGEINLDICFEDANGIILAFRFHFLGDGRCKLSKKSKGYQYIELVKLFVEINLDRFAFRQTRVFPQLHFETRVSPCIGFPRELSLHRTRICEINELGFVWLNFNEATFWHIGDQCEVDDSAWNKAQIFKKLEKSSSLRLPAKEKLPIEGERIALLEQRTREHRHVYLTLSPHSGY